MTQREARQIAHRMAASFIRSMIDTVDDGTYTMFATEMIQSELKFLAENHAYFARNAKKVQP